MRRVFQTDLVALEEHRGPAKREEHHEREPHLGGVSVRPARGQVRHVVVRSRPRRAMRRAGSSSAILSTIARERLRLELVPPTNGKLNARFSSSPDAVERYDVLDPVDVRLTDQQPRRVVLVGDPPPPAQHVVDLGPAGVEHGPLAEHLHEPRVVSRWRAGCRAAPRPSRSCGTRRSGTPRRHGRTRTSGSCRTRRVPPRSTS